MDIMAGRQLGPYTLERLLGSGGMASVYAAQQQSMRREVAVKVLPLALAKSPDYAARFEREVHIAAQLEHPHILPVYDHGIQDDISYVVMRLMPGGSLEDLMQRGEALDSSLMLRIVRQIASALDYAHKQGVIHRDLKASNVLFDAEHNAYLADFGIAKLVEHAGASLTSTGMVMGTPAYMAPEQWQAAPVDARTDIYALGVLVYNLLTGRLPFTAPTPYALMHKHLNEYPEPPSRLQSRLPAQVNHVIETVLAKDINARYPTAQIFLDALEKAIQGQSGTFKTQFVPPDTQRSQATPAAPRQATNLSGMHTQATQNRRGGRVLIGMVVSLLLLGSGLVLFGIFGADPEEGSDEPEVAAAATDAPTETPTHTPSPTATNTLTPTPSPTASPTATNTLTPTPSPTASP
ncbi:MAG: protein kinase domain-containing protein, partial [Anaerolineales bacterium]